MKRTKQITKRISAVFLAILMVMMLSVTAFAAGETGSITLDNPAEGKTYTAYKIFDTVYSGDNYSYTIAGDSEWFTDVNNYENVKLTKAASGDVYSVTLEDGFTAADFAKYLKEKATGKSGTPLQADGDVVKANELPLGYYLVNNDNGALANLTTTNPDVTIHDKNDVPFEKVDDKESVDVGETVTYTITGKVPDTTGFDTFEYTVADTMSAGLTFNDDVTVKIDDAEVDYKTVTGFEYNKNAANDGFTLTIPVKDYQTAVGKTIEITYTAKVNENAVAKVEKNSATLTYSNDPTDSTSKFTTPSKEQTVYSAKVIIDKYAAGDNTKKLEGAEFVLKNSEGKFYKLDTENNIVTWVDTVDDADVKTTNENGEASFDGLKDGVYKLVETKAPDGYNLLDEEQEVTIAGNVEVETSLSVTKEVENSSGILLPSTGGIGTMIFYIAGISLVVAAAVMLVVLLSVKKKSSRN